MKVIAAVALVLASPAAATVVHSDDHGFEVSESTLVKSQPAEALNAFTRVSSWWIADHTYSGSAANLYLDARPGGCLCERFPTGGGIEHMHVNYVEPAKYLIMTGAMGPLLHEAVNGVMIVSVEKEGGFTRLTLDYRASGFANGGGNKFAGMVDKMLGDTIQHYQKFADGRRF